MGTGETGHTKPRREEILDFVEAHPGCHLREVKRNLNLAMGVVQYHIYILEKEGRIISRRRGLYKRFYPNFVFGDKQKEILDVLSQETERDILLYLVQNPDATQKEVSKNVGISPGTVNWHIKRLSSAGLLQTRREGQLVKYHLMATESDILKLLKSYHPSIWQTLTDRLAELVSEVSREDAEEGERGK